MTETKPYTLRKLNGDDLFTILAIAGKVLPEDLASLFVNNKKGEANIEELGGVVGVRIVSAILKDIGKVKKEVYAFLCDVSGLTKEEINALGLFAIPNMVWEIYNSEKNADFFGQFTKSP